MNNQKITIKKDIKNKGGMLFAAKGETVDISRLAELLSKGAISMEDYLTCGIEPTPEEKAKAFISHSIGKVIPCAPEAIKQEVREILSITINSKGVFPMVSSLGRKSQWTYEHSIRVAVLASAIGELMRFTSTDLEITAEGALVHDVGKIFCISLIEKNDLLSSSEYIKMKEHTTSGYRYLKGAGFSEAVAEIALLHHERKDGYGYWRRTDFPDTVEAVCIADSIDAMSAARPYKKAWDIETVVRKLTNDQKVARIYDPNMLSAATSLIIQNP